jgi:TonB family protein
MKIKITSPCPQDFTHIKIAMLSRQCDLCNKPVIDFTKMTREEIILYMLEHSDEKVCGRMNRPFVDIHHDDLPLIIDTLSKQGGNRSFLLLGLICLSLVSCSSPETPENSINIKPKIESNTLEGKVAIADTVKGKDTGAKNNNKTIKQVIPQVILEPSPDPMPEPYPYIEGDIALIEEPPLLANPSPEPKQEEILTIVEVMPEYPGGLKELFSFIQQNMKYPEMEKEAGIQGTVYVQFVVTKEGAVQSPKILRGVNGAPGFDKEVIRIVKMMPNWIPGENGGKKVNVYYTLPVKFRLD